MISRDDARSSRKSDGSGARRAGYLFDDSIQLIAWPTLYPESSTRGARYAAAESRRIFRLGIPAAGIHRSKNRGTNRCIDENPIKLPRVCSPVFFLFSLFTNSFPTTFEKEVAPIPNFPAFFLINNRQHFIFSCLPGKKCERINFASRRESFRSCKPFSSYLLLEKIDHRRVCLSLTYFHFPFSSFCFPSQQKASAHTRYIYSGVWPIFKSSSILHAR